VRHDATNSLDNPFWQYSISVYQDTELQQRLLEGQAFGLDVNVMLFCGYLALQGKTFHSVQNNLRPIERWQANQIGTIRQLRHRVKVFNGEWYAAMKNLELLAEQIEQAMLFQLAKDAQTSVNEEQLIQHNIDAYLEYKNIKPETKWLQALIEHLQPS